MDESLGPEFSRRQIFLAAGAAALVAAVPGVRRVAVPLRWLLGSPAEAATGKAAGDLTLARFAPHVGSSFAVKTGTLVRVPVTLDQATAHTPNPADRPGLTGEAFSLVFRGQRPGQIPDGIHTVVHPVLGTFPLFVANVDRADNGQDYQAVVDRRTPAR